MLLKKTTHRKDFQIYLKNQVGDVNSMLRLNGAGRRYLVNDATSISKGIKVLSVVSNAINCLFVHLTENPFLRN
jgi:hypothetical protein